MRKTGNCAFLSDIHSNLEALSAVLKDFRKGPVYCLGDIVGYGASPNEVIDLLIERGAVCLVGNHDYAAMTGDVGSFNARAGMAAVWTSRRLTDESRAFLSALPRERTEAISGKRVYMTHGSPDDNLWEYVYEGTHRDLFDFYLARLGVDAIALGHTHAPFVWSDKQGMVFNPGSVGQPRAGDRRASYAVFSVESEMLSVENRNVEYDIESAARKIVDAGLPEALATRLFSGW
jgi:putative phosphoesterase